MDENCWADFIENIESRGAKVKWSDFGNLWASKGTCTLNISVKNEKEIKVKDILKSWKMFHGKSGLKQQIEDGGGQAKKWRDSGFSIDDHKVKYSELESDLSLRNEVYGKLKKVSKSGSTSILCDPIKGLDYCIHFDLIKAILAKPPKEKAEEELKTKHSIIQLITKYQVASLCMSTPEEICILIHILSQLNLLEYLTSISIKILSQKNLI